MAMFTILLVAGNTMAQAIRERTNELAVLKTLGFSDGRILGMVLLESVLIALVGGGARSCRSYLASSRAIGDPTGGLLPAFYFPTRDVIARHRARRRRSGSWPASCPPCRPAGCASSTR